MYAGCAGKTVRSLENACLRGAVASPAMSSGARVSPSTFKSDSQQSKYCVACEISWCRCQQLTTLSISTALVTKLLVIEQLLHPAPKSIVSAPWHNFNLCPSSQQILATPLYRCVHDKALYKSTFTFTFTGAIARFCYSAAVMTYLQYTRVQQQ